SPAGIPGARRCAKPAQTATRAANATGQKLAQRLAKVKGYHIDRPVLWVNIIHGAIKLATMTVNHGVKRPCPGFESGDSACWSASVNINRTINRAVPIAEAEKRSSAAACPR